MKMLSNYYYKHIDDYYLAFSFSEKNDEKDITPFLEFFLRAMVDAQKITKERILKYIQLIVLRDYFSFLWREKIINQRQYYLLCNLIDNPKTFTLYDLYHSAPFAPLYLGKSERTARRDIGHLLKLNLIVLSEDGKYDLNLLVLNNL